MGKSLKTFFVACTMPLLASCGFFDRGGMEESDPPDIIGPINGEGYNINTTNQTATFPHSIQDYKIALSEGAGYSIGLIVVQHPENQTLAYFNDTYIKSVEFGGTQYTLDDLQHWDTLIDGTPEQRTDFMAYKFSEAKGSSISNKDCDINGTIYTHFTNEFDEAEQENIMEQTSLHSDIVTYDFQQVADPKIATLLFSKNDEGKNTGGNCEVSLSSFPNWSYNDITINHEIIHAVYGIGHAGFYNVCKGDNNVCDYSNSKIFTDDTKYHTAMSYFNSHEVGKPNTKKPTELDIQAMHLVAQARAPM